MKNVKTFPILFAKSSNGKVKQWEIEAVENQHCDSALIITRHGYIDSKIQESSKEVRGKSIGRSNETTAFEQAIKDAQSKWTAKKDKKYTEDINEMDNIDILLPMLAHQFKKRKHNIKYPCYVQSKLNGVRCLARKTNDGIEYTSRKFKSFTTLGHLTPHLDSIMKVGDIIDGEIFHPDWTFQKIIRNVKKQRETSAQLQYWIYDKADNNKTFEQRLLWLDNRLDTFSLPLVSVSTTAVYSEEEIYQIHKKEFAEKFEGTMVRNADGLYKFDHRSADLQKLKDFIDAEFTIIRGKQGTGNDKGCIIFKVDNPKGLTEEAKDFDVRPRGTVKKRKEWFENLDFLIGKKLTVRYQELSEDNVPIFPVGLAIRDYE